MLRQWLAPMCLEQFVARHLQREPLAGPDAAGAIVPLLTWERLDEVLRAEPADVLIVANGRHFELPAPRNLNEARALLRGGYGLVVRHAERHDAAFEALARAFARELPSTVQVQLFVSAAGTQGFGWHWDEEDVFVVQTCGVKDYYFRRNTVSGESRVGVAPDFELFRRERSQLATARLRPGDWLYIPARWWHMARCVEDSLSISLGVIPAKPAK